MSSACRKQTFPRINNLILDILIKAFVLKGTPYCDKIKAQYDDVVRALGIESQIFKVVCDQAANIKKAFSDTTEAEEKNGGLNLIELGKDLLLQQKQKDNSEKQKSLEQTLLKEIEEMNKLTGKLGEKRK